MLNIKKLLTKLAETIKTLADNNPQYALRTVTIQNFQVPDGTPSNPSTVAVDLADYGITTSIWAVSAYLGVYPLPYVNASTGGQQTWVSRISGHTVTIMNTTSGWGSNLALYLFVVYTGTTV